MEEHKARVLIAEDEAIERVDLHELLVSLGYQVAGEASDGASAVNLARELKPDIVIMDIEMPEMDGIDAAKILWDEKIAPVLLLTAYSQRELVERARDAGVMGYLVKPFRESEVPPRLRSRWPVTTSSANWTARCSILKIALRRAS